MEGRCCCGFESTTWLHHIQGYMELRQALFAPHLCPSSLPCDSYSCQLPSPIDPSCLLFVRTAFANWLCRFALAMLPLLCASAFLRQIQKLPIAFAMATCLFLTTPVCPALIVSCCHAPMPHSQLSPAVLQLLQHTVYTECTNKYVFCWNILHHQHAMLHGQASVHAMQTFAAQKQPIAFASPQSASTLPGASHTFFILLILQASWCTAEGGPLFFRSKQPACLPAVPQAVRLLSRA